MTAATLILAMLVAAAAASGSGLRVTFTKAIPPNKPAVQHVLISWKLRDDAGHPVTLKRVFVRIVCPTGTDFTTTYAKSIAPGLYRADPIVPPGGIGKVTVGAKGVVIRLTNPFHR
ncbi:MAG TPA: hypothetical protein VH496_02920 [Mycobacterium sp.]